MGTHSSTVTEETTTTFKIKRSNQTTIPFDSMLSLYNVATAILLMVPHTLVSAHPNIPKANLQDRSGCPIGYKQSGTLSADNDIPGKALGQSKQSTIDDCKAKCEAHPKCNSFMYGRKDEKYEKNAEQTDKCELAEETAGTNSWGTNFRFCTKQVVCEDKAVLDTFCPFMKSYGHCNEEWYQDYCAKTCGAC